MFVTLKSDAGSKQKPQTARCFAADDNCEFADVLHAHTCVCLQTWDSARPHSVTQTRHQRVAWGHVVHIVFIVRVLVLLSNEFVRQNFFSFFSLFSPVSWTHYSGCVNHFYQFLWKDLSYFMHDPLYKTLSVFFFFKYIIQLQVFIFANLSH